MFFVVPGLIWFTLVGVMVLSLASAAQGAMPPPSPGDGRTRFCSSPEVALADPADQPSLLDSAASVNPVAPAQESISENAGR